MTTTISCKIWQKSAQRIPQIYQFIQSFSMVTCNVSFTENTCRLNHTLKIGYNYDASSRGVDVRFTRKNWFLNQGDSKHSSPNLSLSCVPLGLMILAESSLVNTQVVLLSHRWCHRLNSLTLHIIKWNNILCNNLQYRMEVFMKIFILLLQQ